MKEIPIRDIRFILSLRKLKGRYNLGRVIFVADAGVLNKDNIKELEGLEGERIEYIAGSKLRNLPKKVQEQILDHSHHKEVSEGCKLAQVSQSMCKRLGKSRILSSFLHYKCSFLIVSIFRSTGFGFTPSRS